MFNLKGIVGFLPALKSQVYRVSSDLLMKTKEQYIEEYIEYLYGDIDKDDRPLYQPEITQSIADFKAGFNLAEELFKPKWISVEEQTPDNERSAIIKTFDYRRPKENVTSTTLGYFENGHWFYDSGVYVNDGNGWMIIQWMEIPQ